METGTLLCGGGGHGGQSSSEVAAIFDAMFHGVSLQSLLVDESPLPDFPPCHFSSSIDLPPSPLFSPFSHFSGSPCFFSDDSSPLPLLAPKQEPIHIPESLSEPSLFQTPLPSLHYSIDPSELQISTEPPPELPRFTTTPRSSSCRSQRAAESVASRQRRSNIKEKMQRLQKLMPWKYKKDIATMLEEAYKYIKFLEAQVGALQTMPSQSYWPQPQGSLINSLTGDYFLGGYGQQGRLNRQQLLQAVLNSPASQTALYSHGCCVVSAEQLDLLKENAERMFLTQQMEIDYSSSTSNVYLG